MKFKKFSALMVAAALMAGSLTATAFADDRPAPAESGSKEIDTLALQFVPSRDPEEIISGTSDLPELLIAAMADRGYTIGNVEITVSDSYEAAGEALAAGAIDVAWLPGGTYVLPRIWDITAGDLGVYLRVKDADAAAFANYGNKTNLHDDFKAASSGERMLPRLNTARSLPRR